MAAGGWQQLSKRSLLIYGAESADFDYVQMLMRSAKVSSRNKPECIKRFDSTGVVYVRYQDEKVAEMVLQKKELSLGEHKLTLELNKRPRSVEIYGLPPSMSSDILEVYFDDNEKLGGGLLESVDYHDKDSGIAVITFEEETAAERLLFRGDPVELEGSALQFSTQTMEIDPASIFVTGFKAGVPQEIVELQFDDRGDIENIEYDSQRGEAVISFKDQQVAAQLLAEKELSFRGSTLAISPKAPTRRSASAAELGASARVEQPKQDPRVVVIAGDKITSEEYLEYVQAFFQKKKVGGGEIVDAQLRAKTREAVLTFKDPGVAAIILAKKEFKFDESVLTAKSASEISAEGCDEDVKVDVKEDVKEEGTGKKEEEELESEKLELEKPKPQQAPDVRLKTPAKPATIPNVTPKEKPKEKPVEKPKLSVEGIPKGVTSEYLRELFELERYSSGGPVDRVMYNDQNDTAIIEFTDPAVVERVIRRTEPIYMESSVLKVSKLGSSSAAVSPSILVTGFSDKTTEQRLKLYLERNAEGVIKCMEFEKQSQKAVIHFEDQTAAETLYEQEELVLDGQPIQVSPWQPPQKRQVVVEGIKPSTEEWVVRTFFENKKYSGGGDIEDCQYEPALGKATITFREESDAHQVISKSPFEQLYSSTARWPDAKPKVAKKPNGQVLSSTTAIHNLPPSTKQSDIRKAFQLICKGTIEDLQIDFAQNTALLRFKHVRDEARVLDGGLVINNVPCPTFPVFQASDQDILAVQASGLPAQPDEYMIGLFFSKFAEDAKITDGNNGCDAYINEENLTATVTFENKESVRSILGRQQMGPLMLNKHPINVSRLRHPRLPRMFRGKSEPRTYVLHGSREVSLSELNDYLGLTPSRCQARDLLYGQDERTMLFFCMGDIDTTELWVLCTSRPLKDRMVTIETVPRSYQVIVYRASAKEHQPLLRMHFESPNHSGGGPIREWRPIKKNLLITYDSSTVADLVASKIHKVGNTRYTVRKFHQSFEDAASDYDSRKPWSEVAKPFLFKLSSPLMFTFLIKSSEAKAHIEQMTSHPDCVFYIDWNNSAPGKGLSVNCTPQRPGSINSIKRHQQEWETHCCQRLKTELISRMDTASLTTLDDVFRDILDIAEKEASNSPAAVMVQSQRDQSTINLVGWKPNIEALSNKLRKENKVRVEKCKRAKHSTTDIVTLENHQVKMIKKLNSIAEIMIKWPHMKVKLEGKQLRLNGLAEEIQKAKNILMEDILNVITVDSYESRSCQKILMTEGVEKHLQSVFADNGLHVVLEPTDTDITVYTMSQGDMKKAEQIMRKHVVSEEISLGDQTRTVTKNTQWTEMVKLLTSQNPCSIKVVNDKVEVACLEKHKKAIIQDIKNCLNTHALEIKVVTLLSGEAKLLTRDDCKNLRPIKDKFSTSYIQFVHMSTGIKLLASKTVFNQVKKELQQLVSRILTSDYKLDRAWVAEFFHSPKGADCVADVERKHEVTCEFIDSKGNSASEIAMATGTTADGASKDSFLPGSHPNSVCTQEGIQLLLVKGNIAQLQVDAIMNTPKEGAHMKGSAVSDVLHKAGGPQIQEELKKAAPKGLRFGEVLQTTPGNLAANGVKAIYHAPCTHWNQGQNGEERSFRTMLQMVLTSMADDDMRSIAMPAVGMGKLKWPRDVVPRLIFEEVKRFSRKYPGTQLRQVSIVLYEKDTDTIKAFETYLKSVIDPTSTVAGSSKVQAAQDQPAVRSRLERLINYGKSITGSNRGDSATVGLTDATVPSPSLPKKDVQSPAAPASDVTQLVDRGPDQFEFCVRHIMFTVEEGDITKATTEAIVNSANTQLDTSQGGVTKAILNAAGKNVKKECADYIAAHKSVQGVVQTSSGNLPCDYILHIHIDNGNEIQKAVFDVLKYANDNGIDAVTFPALGTGQLNVSTMELVDKMVSAVREYSQLQPTLTEVCVRVLGRSLLGDFRDSVRTLAACPGAATANIPQSAASPSNTTQTSRAGAVSKVTDTGPGNFNFWVESVKFIIEEGDITKATTEAIVNSANTKLDTSQGGVTKAILNAAGRTVKKECEKYIVANKTVKGVVKTSGGNLPCDYILHIHIDNGNEIQKAVFDVLKYANDNGIDSVTFPALGTGQLNVSTKDLVDKMVNAVLEYSQLKPKLTEVCVRVLGTSLVGDFRDSVKALAAGSAATAANIPQSAGAGPTPPIATMLPAADISQVNDVGPDEFEFCVRDIEFTVLDGDITQAPTSAIVNSANKQLDDSQGEVTKAILNAAGPSVKKECQDYIAANKTVKGVVQTSGGNLQCDYILHIHVDNGNEIQKAVFDVLKYANDNGIDSITFPALGTGQLNVSTKELVDKMVSAVFEYSQLKPKLTEIFVRVLGKSLLGDFRDSVKALAAGSGTAAAPVASVPTPTADHQPAAVADYTELQAAAATLPRKTIPAYVTDLMLRIYAMKSDDLKAARKFVDEKFYDLTSKQVFDQPDEKFLIAQLHREQVSHITSMASTRNIELEIEIDPQTGPCITIEGAHKDVMELSQEINKVLRHTQSAKDKEKQAKIMYKQVKWEYDDNGVQFKPYPEMTSYVIETAHEDKRDRAEWKDSGDQWVADFSKMTATNTGNNFSVNIRRKMEGADAIKIPKQWDCMPVGKRYIMVDLAATSEEYSKVAKKFLETSPKLTIVKIQRVQCPIQYQSYMVKKKHMEETCPPDVQIEKIMFHGTSADVIESINTSGFNRSYCGKNATAYGKGVYFAVRSAYSAQPKYSVADKSGNRYMYLCKVLTGRYTKGKSVMLVPPPIDDKDPNILYDSVVNDMQKIDMHVVFYDTQAYPEHLITFQI